MKHIQNCSSNQSIFQVDSIAFQKVIEWLYSGQAKLTIPQCEDAMLLAKQCKLEQLKEEIQQAVNKANSFGKHFYPIFLLQNFFSLYF